MPAKAGIQYYLFLDSRLRGNDKTEAYKSGYTLKGTMATRGGEVASSVIFDAEVLYIHLRPDQHRDIRHAPD